MKNMEENIRNAVKGKLFEYNANRFFGKKIDIYRQRIHLHNLTFDSAQSKSYMTNDPKSFKEITKHNLTTEERKVLYRLNQQDKPKYEQSQPKCTKAQDEFIPYEAMEDDSGRDRW